MERNARLRWMIDPRIHPIFGLKMFLGSSCHEPHSCGLCALWLNRDSALCSGCHSANGNGSELCSLLHRRKKKRARKCVHPLTVLIKKENILTHWSDGTWDQRNHKVTPLSWEGYLPFLFKFSIFFVLSTINSKSQPCSCPSLVVLFKRLPD